VNYDLSHLTQSPKQDVIGPIQDDEALFLYALVRVKRMKTVLELGCMHGYSALNFLEAVGPDGIVFSCDVSPMPKMGGHHVTIQKSAALLTPLDFDGEELELVFFDCHDYEASLAAYASLRKGGVITPQTILALHDTGTHPVGVYSSPTGRIAPDAWVHQPTERRLVNHFVAEHGYHALCLHTEPRKHGAHFPFRHGLTILCQHVPLRLP
jgi:O-methyltransferase